MKGINTEVMATTLVLFFTIGLLFYVFSYRLKSDGNVEKELMQLATEYTKDEFHSEIKMNEIMHDYMGNFPDFEYAVKAHDEEDGIDFLIYENKKNEKIEDTYIANKFAQQLKATIIPFLEEKLGTWERFFISYDQRIGSTFEINVNEKVNYTEFAAKPSILLFVPRDAQKGDENIMYEIIEFLKNGAGLHHGQLTIEFGKNGTVRSRQF
ncbi:hypothetical protein [Bacillus sp. 2205SS5-2]|uniref:hypothetical protein n=1 Tax=Bacillus sp. 2205SS5-2 TaxID=3109031 RepID=UPI003007CD7C